MQNIHENIAGNIGLFVTRLSNSLGWKSKQKECENHPVIIDKLGEEPFTRDLY